MSGNIIFFIQFYSYRVQAVSGECAAKVLGQVDFGKEGTFEPQVHVLAEGKL